VAVLPFACYSNLSIIKLLDKEGVYQFEKPDKDFSYYYPADSDFFYFNNLRRSAGGIGQRPFA